MAVDETRSAAASVRQDPLAWPAPPDPGDLSKRLAARRAELKLSLAQVARRADVSVRYLEYLEKFPSQPGWVVLRRLAAALRTTPAILLGAAGRPARDRTAEPGLLARLAPAECLRLLTSGEIGRVAFATAAGVAVLPVNYRILAGSVVLRTGSGSLIAAHGDGAMSFEADHLDEVFGQGWSVLVRGLAHRVLQAGELRNLRQECDPRPWPAGEHDLYIRIVPDRITGRRIELRETDPGAPPARG